MMKPYLIYERNNYIICSGGHNPEQKQQFVCWMDETFLDKLHDRPLDWLTLREYQQVLVYYAAGYRNWEQCMKMLSRPISRADWHKEGF